MEFALNFYLGKKVVLFLVGRRNISFPEGEGGSLIITERVGTLPLLWQKGVRRLEGKKSKFRLFFFIVFGMLSFVYRYLGSDRRGLPRFNLVNIWTKRGGTEMPPFP